MKRGKKWSVVFDLDGVLLDSGKDTSWINRAIRKTLEFFSIPVDTHSMELLHPRNLHSFMENSRILGVSADELWRVRNRFYVEEKINAMKKRKIQPFEDVDALYRLKEFYELNIISNSPQSVVDFFVSEFNYESLFSHYIGRGEGFDSLKQLKPNPFLFQKLLQYTSRNSFYYVGDSSLDEEFAENTGMVFLLLDRRGNKVYSSLYDIVEFLLE